MACKRDIKASIIDKISQLSATKNKGEINSMFGIEVVKPSGRIFVDSNLVDKYWNEYSQSTSLSPAFPSSSVANQDKLELQNEAEKKSLYQERARLYEQANRTADADVKIGLLKRVEDVNNRILTLSRKQQLYDNINIDTLQRGANIDFTRVDTLLDYTGTDLAIRLRNIEEAQRIVNFYREVGDFSVKENFLFDDIDKLSDEEKEFWQDLRNQADGYQSTITEIHRQTITDYTKQMPTVQKWLENNNLADIDYEFLVKPVKDKDWLSLQGLGLSDSLFGEQVLVLDVLEYLIKKYENTGIKQRRDVITKIDELLEKIHGKHNKFDDFKQLDENGKHTGRIIYPYAQKFWEIRREHKRNVAREISRLLETGDAKSVNDAENLKKKLRNWQLENEIFVDYRYMPEVATMFPDFNEFLGDDVDKQEYKQKLISHLGQKGYDALIERVERNLRDYKIMLDYHQQMGEEDLAELVAHLGVKPGVRINNVTEAMQLWKALNSPFYAAGAHHSIVPPKVTLGGNEYVLGDASEITGRNFSYTEEVPRRNKGKVWKRDRIYTVTDTRETTGYYDERFRKIEQDNDLYEFWKFAVHNLSTAKDMMPYKYQKEYGPNSIMYMEKTVMEQLTEKGALGLAYSSAYDAIVKSLTDRELSTESFDENPFAPGTRAVNYSFLGQRQQLEDRLYKAKLLEFFIKEGIEATPDNIRDTAVKTKLTSTQRKDYYKASIRLRKEAQQEIAEKASFDLGSVLKFHLGTMVAFNQRENIMPVLNAYERTLKEIKKVKTNRAGQSMTRENRLMSTDLPAENIIKRGLYSLDVFTGQPVQDIEAPSNKKMFTQDEKIEMKRLDILKEKASEEQKQAIDKLIEGYGREISGSGTMDTALAYLRLRGLGWNVSAQIPNAAAGYFANFAVAADGRIVKMSALRRAYNLFWHVIMPSFLRSSAKTSEVKKIKALMYRGDFLLDATSEMQKSRFSSEKGLKSKEEWLSPYMPTRVTEYMNQGVLVAARLMTIQVTNNKGELKPLWEALDENLNVKPEFANISSEWDWDNGKLMEKEQLALRELINHTHGDYTETGRQYAKRKITGRMALFFKTWLPNAIKARFGMEKPGELFYDLPIKGRYRSYTPATAALAGAGIGSWVAPGIGTFIGYGIGFGVAKIWGNDVNENIAGDFKDSIDALGALLKRLVYSKLSLINPSFADKLDTQFDGKFNELDAANLRANLQEIQNMLTLLLVYFVAKAALYDDDEAKKNQIVHNYIINQIVKIQQDLVLYTSPQSPGKFIEQAIPVSRLVDQSFGIILSANKAMFGLELKPNENSFGENVSKLFPRPMPSVKTLERTYGESKMLKSFFEEE